MASPWSRRLHAWAPKREQLEANPYLRRLAPHLGHPKLWHWSRRSVAAGMAVGLLVGLAVPLVQLFPAVAVAILLRVNVPVAALATLVSNPLTLPPLYYVAYHLGTWVMGGTADVSVSWSDPTIVLNALSSIGLPLLVGLGLLACVVAMTAYLLISWAWMWNVRAKRRR